MTTKAKKNGIFWIRLAVSVILGVLLLINLLTVLFSELGMRRSLDWMPGAFITIESGSMEPELHKGDLAFVWRTSYQKLEIGDIVTIFSDGEYITHGIIRVDRENGRIVTKGLQNNVEGAPVGEQGYCAKMLFAIPGGAKYYEKLSEPAVTVLLLLLVAMAFFGVPVFSRIYNMFRKNHEKARRIGTVRVLGSLFVASVIFVTPLMTSAKYFVEINGLAMPSAGAVYFTSNFLSPETNDYRIQGWDGNSYIIELDIRNYSNDLLFNGEDVDVPYTLSPEIISEEGYRTDYTCEILMPDGKEYRPLVNPEPETDPGTDPETPGEDPETPIPDEYDAIQGDNRPRKSYYQINGNATGGKVQSFKVKIESPHDAATGEIVPMSPGQKIKFRITAETIPEYMYHQVMSAEYTLEVAAAGSFLGARSFQQSTGSTLVTYTLKTNQIAGISHRKVVIEWNSEDMYINEYDPTYLSLIVRNGNSYVNDGDTATLTLSLQAFSSINLQFFKYSGKLGIIYEDFHETVTGADNVEYDKIQLRDENYVPPMAP